MARDRIPKPAAPPAQFKRPNATGLPDRVKTGVEQLSGLSLDRVQVNYHSPEPARLGAEAITRGHRIDVAPGGEHHLPHEAWHVVQQAKGRVAPTTRAAGVAVNDDARLEREADVMGRRALAMPAAASAQPAAPAPEAAPAAGVAQMAIGKTKRVRKRKGHKRKHVDMKYLRTVTPGPKPEYLAMEALAKAGGFALPKQHIGPLRAKSMGLVKVINSKKKRAGKHADTFKDLTGERSANTYMEQEGLNIPNLKFEILHGNGYAQVGEQGDRNANNLAAGSSGANTQMIPYDGAISGNGNIRVGTEHHTLPNSEAVAEIHQKFFHPAYQGGGKPFFHDRIDGFRPPVPLEEYEGHQQRAAELAKYIQLLDQAHGKGEKVEDSFDQWQYPKLK